MQQTKQHFGMDFFFTSMNEAYQWGMIARRNTNYSYFIGLIRTITMKPPQSSHSPPCFLSSHTPLFFSLLLLVLLTYTHLQGNFSWTFLNVLSCRKNNITSVNNQDKKFKMWWNHLCYLVHIKMLEIWENEVNFFPSFQNPSFLSTFSLFTDAKKGMYSELTYLYINKR